jgi:2-polyprenyl-6-hydroxyphenyl methylase/3-demethylubiquinone-9 3-methyltransferase
VTVTQQGEYVHEADPRFVRYYAEASLSPQTRERFENVRRWALALLEERGRGVGPFDVLDIGCGAGSQAVIWGEAGHRVRGLDVNQPLVDIGRRRAAERELDVEFHVGSATALPFEDGSADVVLLSEILEHVAEWEACLSEAVRVLRPGGLLFVSTSNWLCPKQQEFRLPMYSWYPGPVKRWCERRAVSTHKHWANHATYPAVNWFSFYSLRRWLRRRGLVSLDRFDVLARKPIGASQRARVTAVRTVPGLRLLAHAMTQGTVVWAFKPAAAGQG